MENTTTQTQQPEKSGLLNAVPAWGSYLYQNFLLPALSPTSTIANEWLNLGTPFGNPTPTQAQPQPPAQPDYFGQSWQPQQPFAKVEPAPQPQPLQRHSVAGPSNYYPQPFYYNGYQTDSASSIPTSLLFNAITNSASSSTNISPSVDVVDAQYVRSPSPLNTSMHTTPHDSPRHAAKRVKRRMSSMDEDHYSHDEHEPDPDVPEGVERDGMIWGMRVEDYRALSARERKRVRNRISARTFRAKRKEHLSSLETTLSAKDLQVKLANEQAAALRREVSDLRRRLAKYEKV